MPTPARSKSGRKAATKATVLDKALAAVVFLAILGGALFVTWYLQRPTVKQFPDTIDVKHAEFMSSIPSGVVHFRMLNITEITSRPAGAGLIGNATLISLLIPRINVTMSDAEWVVDTEFIESSTESTVVNVVGLTTEGATKIGGMLNMTSSLLIQDVAGFLVYRVRTMNNTWAEIAVSGYILVYHDKATVTRPLEQVLGAISGSVTRLFDDESVKRAYYLATLEMPVFGVSLTGFSSLPTTGVDVDWMFSFARYDGDRVDKTDVFGLSSQQAAIDAFDEAKTLYFMGSQSQYIIGSFIVAGYSYEMGDLRTVLLSL